MIAKGKGPVLETGLTSLHDVKHHSCPMSQFIIYTPYSYIGSMGDFTIARYRPRGHSIRTPPRLHHDSSMTPPLPALI